MFNKPKKLKRIPADLVSYIQIETESIETASDKMMIASYCANKLELVEWYIELLESGSDQYIVPQNKAYLEKVRDQLAECHKAIMRTRIAKRKQNSWLDVNYPEGYEG